MGIGREFWHDLDPSQAEIEQREEKYDEVHQVDGVKGRSDLATHDAEVTGCDGPHALEGTPFEGQQVKAVAGSGLGKH